MMMTGEKARKRAWLKVPDTTDTAYIAHLKERMTALVGEELDFEVTEERKMLAGFICEVNGKVYSNSVEEKLARLKKDLMRR